MKKIGLVSFLVLLMSLSAFAQDKIYKKNGDILEVSVVEIGESEIKYRLFNDPNGPIYVLDKDRLTKTIYQNGREEVYTTSLKDPTLYADQAKTALKINFLSPIFGSTKLSYEKSLRPGRSYEITLGLIGIGRRQELYEGMFGSPNGQKVYRGAAGAFVGAGYKFMTLPSFTRNGDKYSHVLQGLYAKPELILGNYSQNTFDINTQTINSKKENISMGAFIINIGKQWVFGDMLLIDIYAGLGYAATSQKIDPDKSYYSDRIGSHFAMTAFPQSGLGFTSGVKVGLLINKPKK